MREASWSDNDGERNQPYDNIWHQPERARGNCAGLVNFKNEEEGEFEPRNHDESQLMEGGSWESRS